MNFSWTKVFLYILLFLSLFPVFLMFFTSIIPSGSLMNIVKTRYINDFETKYSSYLKRKVLSEGYMEIAPEAPQSANSLKVKGKVTLLTDKLDARTGKEITFWAKGKRHINVFIFDAFGNSEKFNFPLETNWRLFSISTSKMNKINTRYISKITFESSDTFMIDDVVLKYKFPTFANYINVLKEDLFMRYLINSTIVSIVVVLGNLIFSTMVGYAFARRKFPGKSVLFYLILSMMIIPPQVTIVPNFILMKSFGWIDTYLALTIPFLVTPFSVFLVKQYVEQLPIELEQAAYVDGASTFQILFKIIFPLARPALAVVGINTFISTWNDLFYSLVMINSREMRTVQVGLALYQKLNQIDWPKLMAASSLASLPVIVVFLIFQRHIISGLVQGAIKD